jgi:TnpA family transposase
MPVKFLTPEQLAQHGPYAGEPSPAQLARYFYLDDADQAILALWREDHTRLGFALQLSAARFLGAFLADLQETPPGVVTYLARQLDIAETSGWQAYVESKTARRHRQFIRQQYGYEEFHQSPRVSTLLRQLYARTWLTAEKQIVLFDYATAWLVQNKVLLPGPTVLERLIARLTERADQRLWQRLNRLVTKPQAEQLRSLLLVEEGKRFSGLELLRRREEHASTRTMNTAMRRLTAVRAFGLGDLNLVGLPVGRLKALSRYGLTAWASAIDDLGQEHGLATLLITVRELETMIQDEVLDLLLLIMTDKFKDAAKNGLKARLQLLTEVDAATGQVCTACQFILDDNLLADNIRETIFAQIPKESLTQAVTLLSQEISRHGPHYYDELACSYRSIRQFLPTLLQTVAFKSIADGTDLLSAWRFLYRLDHEKPQPDLQDAPQSVITNADWRRVVLNSEKTVDRRYYTFCVLHHLLVALQRRDIFVMPSLRWQDQRQQLLSGEAWQKARPHVCAALGKSTDGAQEMAKLATQLDQLYRQVAKRFGQNKLVSIKKEGEFERISLSRPEKLAEGKRLVALKQQVDDLLPPLDLPDLLLEIAAITGFTDEFSHISEKQARVEDLSLSICAVLLAEACNVGLDDVAHSEIPALRRSRLLWVQQNYIRDETLTRANGRLVAAQTDLALAKLWGSGDVASADGQRFKLPLASLNAMPSWKYFGEGHGVTFFTFTSDQFTSFYGAVIPGAVREAMYILDGLLEQQTVLKPVEVMADTAGYTDIVFGLFWLLGYQFSPRLRDIGKTRFWRIDKKARYGALHKVARHQINVARIVANWDELLRVAASLKMGCLSASELMKTLQAGKGSSSLAKAIAEVGRIAKTIYLLHYIDEPEYRRRILVQLNRGEQRHQVARAVFHGRRGELRQKYQEGQEDQLGALGLAVNMIVLWNTLYMGKAIEHLPATGVAVHEEDVKRLTPLWYDHIRLTGRYAFALTAKPEVGGLRPLQQKRQ